MYFKLNIILLFISSNVISCFYLSIEIFITVKAFVVTPKMAKNSIILRGGYYKGYKNFIADENLFVCILIYFNKTYIFIEFLKC